MDSPNITGPPEHQVYWTRLGGEAVKLITDLRRLTAQGGDSLQYTIPFSEQMLRPRLKAWAERGRQACASPDGDR